MDWNELNRLDQLEALRQQSFTRPVLIFKHSTQCGISAMALDRLERKWETSDLEPYFLDLLSYREVSDGIESEFNVMHQSPQVIVLREGQVVHHASHNAIDFQEINSAAKNEQHT